MIFEPKFLISKQVEALYKLQIDQFGGTHGVRDEGLPLPLGQNHPFLDGNKRIATLTAALFFVR